MTIIVNTRDLGEIRVTRGQSWLTESDNPGSTLDILDSEQRTVATFRDWLSVHASHEEPPRQDDEVAVRVEVSAGRIAQIARARPHSKSELADRIVRQATEVAREQAWKFLLSDLYTHPHDGMTPRSAGGVTPAP